MPAFSMELSALLPWVYALALFPVALIAARGKGVASGLWGPAQLAGYLGFALVVVALVSAAFDGQQNDRLGLVMAALVALLAVVIINYSRRYLEGEPGQVRYILALLGTLAAVATVVITHNLYLLVGAWILSSLCLHQLLTFYRDRPMAQVAAHKKFLVSRLADLCLVAATFLLVQAGGSSSIPAIIEGINEGLAETGGVGWRVQLATLLLALTVILKSAQLPVHGWLIQVMEAPTPVSALLHAGLVNLGGFVVLRFASLFSLVPAAQSVLVIVGGLTAVLAALVMMTRISIKVRLAWSTCAQMGFMLMELGLGLYELALVHLLAHSLYKAHAFLGAGDTVARARRQELIPEAASQGLAPLLLALPFAALWVALLHWLWTLMLPAHEVPLVALVVLTIGLAPWCFRTTGLLHGLVVLTALPSAYLLWHLGGAYVLGEVPVPAVHQTFLAMIMVALFLTLYAVQSWITVRPGSWLAQRLYPLAFAGFFLDEHFTRLTFRLWPVRRPLTL
jgi:NAD(P)H-quinone oxidoreductase subunit 5